jgi:apolipoprotein N-acyltransferase
MPFVCPPRTRQNKLLSRTGKIPDMSRRRALAAIAASGIGLWLASPSVGLGWLAWVAIVPVAIIVLEEPDERPVGARFVVPAAYLLWLELALIPDLPPGIAEDQWGDPVIPLIADTPAPFVAVFVLPALALVLALIGFGLPWAAHRLPGPLRALAAVAVPALAWTALEVIEIRTLPGGWWATVAAGQATTPGGRLAALGGPYLITLAIVAVNYALALAIVRRSGATAIGATVLVAAVAAAAAFAPVATRDAGEELVVAAVQPGYDTAEDVPATRAFGRRHYVRAALEIADDLEPLTQQAAAAGARLIVWPEATVWVDPSTPPVRRRLSELAEETQAAIVVSIFRPGPATSAVLVVGSDGSLSEPVPKQRPMWYLGERGRGAGPARSIAAAGTRIGTMPGVDNEDPAVARELVADGARVLVSVTHDWEQLAIQQRAFAALDALATGVPLVRSDWRFGSGIWAADGTRLTGDSVGRERQVLTATVAPGRPTPYVSTGDIVGDGALIAMLLLPAALAMRAAVARARS